jgi:putative Holliday junction resolvase
MTPLPLRGRIVGIDYGHKRIGIAVADNEVRIATPLDTYERKNPTLDAAYFQRLAKEEQAILFIVGLPVHTDGRESESSLAARRFGVWLHELTQVPVEYFDERYTSVEAESILGAAELTKKQRKARIDRLAAHILLTNYLESSHPHDPPQGLEG